MKSVQDKSKSSKLSFLKMKLSNLFSEKEEKPEKISLLSKMQPAPKLNIKDMFPVNDPPSLFTPEPLLSQMDLEDIDESPKGSVISLPKRDLLSRKIKRDSIEWKRSCSYCCKTCRERCCVMCCPNKTL